MLLLAALFVLLLVIHLSVGWLLAYQLEERLHPQQGKGTYLGSVHSNLFTGKIAIEGLQVLRQQQPQLTLRDIVLDIDMQALIQGRLVVEYLGLGSGEWRVIRLRDGSIDPGFKLPVSAESNAQAETSEAATSALPFQLKWLKIKHFNFLYADQQSKNAFKPLRIEQFDLANLSVPAKSERAVAELLLHWGKAEGRISGDFLISDFIDASADVVFKRLPIQATLQLLRQQQRAEGALNLDLNLRLKQQKLQSQAKIQLSQAGFASPTLNIKLGKAAIDKLRLNLDLSTKQPKGKLNLSGLALNTVSLQASESQIQSDRVQLRGMLGMDIAEQSIDLQQGQLHLAGFSFEQKQSNDSELQKSGDWSATRLKLNKIDISDINAQLALLAQQLQGKLQLFRIDLDDVVAQSAQSHMSSKAVHLEGDIDIDVSTQTASVKQTKLSISDLRGSQGQTTEIAAKTIALNELALTYPVSAATVETVGVEGLKLKHADLQGEGFEVAQISVKALNLGDTEKSIQYITVNDLIWQEYPLELAAFEVSNTRMHEQGVALGQVKLNDFSSRLERAPNGEWLLPIKLPKAKSTDTVEAEAMQISVQSIEVSGKNTLSIMDAQTNPPMQQQLSFPAISVGGLDSANPDKNTDFKVHLLSGDNTDLELQALIRPFAKEIYINAKGELSNFPLVQVDSFATQNLGHRFHDGYMDDQFTIKIVQRQLQMQNKLELLGLDVEALEGKEGPPIGLAVSLLEDRDGRIELEVPANGSLDDPNFTVSGALSPVLTKAIAGAGLLSIQPLGSVVLLGNLLVNQALKVTFEPAEFAPKSSVLKNREDIQALAKKLIEKPKLKIRLCGRAVEADRPKTNKGKKADKTKQDEQLLALAEKRAQAVRDVMLAQGSDRKQLRNCRAQLDDSAQAKPRVEIKL